MSLERLQELILNQAQTRAQQVATEFQTTLQQEEARIKERSQQIEEQVLRQAELEGTIQANQVYQTGRLQARAAILQAKQAELDKTKTEVIKQVLAWPKEQVQDFLASLFVLIPKDKEGHIQAGKLQYDAVKFIAHKHKIKLADETIPDESGFIYTSPTVEMNLTVTRLVNELFARHRSDLAQKLFS